MMNSIAPPDSPMDVQPLPALKIEDGATAEVLVEARSEAVQHMTPPEVPPLPTYDGRDINGPDSEGPNENVDGDYSNPMNNDEDDAEMDNEDLDMDENEGHGMENEDETKEDDAADSLQEEDNFEDTENHKFAEALEVSKTKTFVVDQQGPLGVKLCEQDGDLVVQMTIRGKMAEIIGMKQGDMIVSASLYNKKAASPKWSRGSPSHVFYSLLLSKERPIALDIQREEGFEGYGTDFVKRKVEEGEATKAKKRRKSVGDSQDIELLRSFREGILHADKLRTAANEIETKIMQDHSEVGGPTQEIVVAQVAQMRREFDELWNNPRHTFWEESFKELIEYRNKYGHVNVTRDTASKSLVDWVGRMRDVHTVLSKSGKTGKARNLRALEAEFLNRIGFVWFGKHGKSSGFDVMFNRLLAFKEKHGHMLIKRRHTDKETLKLANWVHHQRQKYFEKHDPTKKKSKGLLTDEQERRLTEAGFVWKAHNKKTWEDQYADLKSWVELHGHAKVPKVYPENQPLSSFVHTMRRYHMWLVEGKERAQMAAQRLTPERKRLLDEIGMIWDANGSSLVSKRKASTGDPAALAGNVVAVTIDQYPPPQHMVQVQYQNEMVTNPTTSVVQEPNYSGQEHDMVGHTAEWSATV